MNRRTSRLLPFGDKNAMLVIVFLVLSLGVGALRSDHESEPVSALHPALLTLRQSTQGYLGVEKLVFLGIGQHYFVDQPVSRPTGLAAHSTTDATTFPENGVPRANRQEIVLTAALSEGSVFSSAGAKVESTGVVLETNLTDRDTLLHGCVSVLQSSTPAVSIGGHCQAINEIESLSRDWGKSRAIAEFFPSELSQNQPTTTGRCVGGRTCNFSDGGADISFSGVNSEPWNGAAVTFNDRSSFKKSRRVVGMLCGLEATSQNFALTEIRQLTETREHIIYPGLNEFHLFEKGSGFGYIEKRLQGNAETAVDVTVFDPNARNSVQQSRFKFNGIRLGNSLPDGVVFSTLESCGEVNEFSKSGGALSSRPGSYPWQILRVFSFDFSEGKISGIFGVDEIEVE